MKTKTKKLVTMSMLCAVSVILVALIRFPIFPAAPYLEYDPADIPILMGTLMFGSVGGLLITIIVSIIQGITVSAQSGIIGIIMHIFATGMNALTVGLIYKKKSTKRLVIALVCGVITMTVSMVIWNLIITPLYLGVPLSAVKAMIIPIIIPFNLLKAGMNAIGAAIIYNLLKKIKIF